MWGERREASGGRAAGCCRPPLPRAPLLQAQLAEDVHQQVIGQLLEALRGGRGGLVFAGSGGGLMAACGGLDHDGV